MPAPFVQKANSGTPSGTATTKSVTLNGQAAGNLNLVYVSFGNGSGTAITQVVTSVVDDLGNPYLAAGAPVQTTPHANSAILIQTFYRAQIPAGNRTITVTVNGAVSFFIVGVAEYAVTGASPFVNASSYSNDLLGGTATAKTGNTYANANDLAVAFFASNDTMSATPGAGYTTRDQIYTIMLEDQQLSAAGLTNATGTSNGTSGWVGQLVIFHVSGVPITAAGEVLLSDTFLGNAGDPTVLQGANSWVFWATGSGTHWWAQVNAGAPCKLTRFRLSAIAGGEDLIAGCTLSACNDPTFQFNPVTLYTGSTRLLSGTLVNEIVINSATPYQYYRFTTGTAAPSATVAGCITDLDVYVSWAPGCVFQPADIAISPAGGNYDIATYVTLSSITSSAVINYTLDGSTPTPSSALYSNRLLINASCTLQAIAVSPAQAANSRILNRPVHIGNTEVSVDNIYDSRNYRLWAMNGSLFFDPVSKYWYRYGNNSDTPHYYGYGFAGNMCYRSADLRNWDFRGQLMPPAAGTADTATNKRWHIAFHILYNALNNNYVAWADTYDMAPLTWVGKTSWTSPSPEGPFTLVQTLHNFPGIPTTGTNDWGQGDFTLFLDSDGSGYLLSAMGNGTSYDSNLFTAKLTADFTNISATTQVVTGLGEALAAVKVGNLYFLFYSGSVGFNSSDCHYSTASSIMGPWLNSTRPFQPAPGGTPDYTIAYDSQVWFVVQIPGRSQGFIYHGDRYAYDGNAFPNLKRLRLPAIISGSTVTINWFDAWSFDSKMPPISGAPAQPSGLVVTGSGATWANNEPGPNKLYLDMASDANFTQNVSSLPVPDGGTSAANVPSATFYRVRSVNASGSSFSNTVTAAPPPPSDNNPPFLMVKYVDIVPKGGWNTYTGPQEDGPGLFVNPINSSTPVRYNGQSQTATINIRIPKPV